MSDSSNGTTATTATTTTAAKTSKVKARQVYPTLDAAKANKPADATAKERVIEVVTGGVSHFVWAGNAGKGLLAVARRDGYTAKIAEPKSQGPLTKEKLGAALAAMTDEDRAILIRQYVPAPTPAPAATVDVPAPVRGRGKK